MQRDSKANSSINQNYSDIPKDQTVSNGKVLQNIYKSVLRIMAPMSTEELYPLAAKELQLLVGCKFVSIYRIFNNELSKIYTSYPKLESVHPRKEGFTYKSFNENQPFIINNQNISNIHPELKGTGIVSNLFIPLTYNSSPIGVLSLDFKRSITFSEDVLYGLLLFANLLGYKMMRLENYSRLKELVENQNLFISLASHELKNPLTALKGYASLLNRAIVKGKPINPELTKLLLAEVNRMDQIISDFLNTRSSGVKNFIRYNKKQYSLHNILHHISINFQFTHPTRKLLIRNTLKRDVTLYIDYQKIIQLFSNLINNAVKFSDKSTRIKMEIESQNGWYVFRIIDRGVGIHKKDLSKVFNEFYRGSQQKKEGMGLGLYLCKQIVDQHGGKIEIDSKRGKGTTVQIHLPKSENSE